MYKIYTREVPCAGARDLRSEVLVEGANWSRNDYSVGRKVADIFAFL